MEQIQSTLPLTKKLEFDDTVLTDFADNITLFNFYEVTIIEDRLYFNFVITNQSAIATWPTASRKDIVVINLPSTYTINSSVISTYGDRGTSTTGIATSGLIVGSTRALRIEHFGTAPPSRIYITGLVKLT